MEFKITNESLEKIKADCVALICPQKTKDKDDKGIAILQKSDGGIALDDLMEGSLSRLIKEEAFRGELGTVKIVNTNGKIPARTIILVGAGKSKEFNLESLRKIGAKITKVANQIHATSVAGVIQPENISGFGPADRVVALTEGLILGGYKFLNYKDEKDSEKDTLKNIVFAVKGPTSKIEWAVQKGKEICGAITLTRDLVNTPAKDMTPEILAKKAEEVARECKLGCKIFGKKEIAAEKMNLLLAVAKGAANEPKFIHMTYKPAKKAKMKVALVGKGLTFDSGGYNIKTGPHMSDMKCDMAGGASVIAIMKLVAKFKPAVQVDAYVPATDNMVDAEAIVPGDIIKSRLGKTVEIVNTDAEGRLILADALSYANDNKPDVIIDIATLTGGVRYALGEIYTAVLGNDQKTIDKFLDAASVENEFAWQLPIVKEYRKGMTDTIADLRNMGKTGAGTICGALFLNEFVGETKWIHLDIAESAWSSDGNDYTQKGGTGGMVRSVFRFIEKL